MATLHWRGDAQGRAQVDFLTPENVEAGDVFTATINRKDVSYTAVAGDGIPEVVAGLVAAINASEVPEFEEVTASSGTNDDGDVTHVVVTGPDDGKPFTLTAATTDAGEGEVTITVLVAGVAPLNEIQRVRLGGTPTGGTFTLTFAGQTTGAIAYNANAAAVVTALELLSNIGAGDVTVTELATSDWTVEFIQNYAETDVPLLTGSGASLTGACSVSVTTTQDGGDVNEIQDVAGTIGSTSFTLTFNGETTTALTFNMAAAQIKARLELLPSVNSGDVQVTESTSGTTKTFRVTFVGGLAGIDHAAMTFADAENPPPGGEITTIQDGGAQNETQQVSLVGTPTGGTFTLTFQGATTAAIAYNADAATVDAALEALANIGAGDVTCTGGPLPGTAVVVEFTTTLANTDVQQMTGNGSSLTGAGVNVSVTQEAVAGVNEQQQIEIDTSANGGTFTLSYSGQTTAGIAYDASAATVDAALELLSNIGAGDVTCTGGPLPGTAIVVEFTTALAETDVDAMTGDGSALTTAGSQDLTRSASVTPTGPNYFDEAENWSGGTVPATGDTVVFENSDVDCLYGLETQAAETLTLLQIEASYTGRIGLPQHTGLYQEYRPQYLKVGATTVSIGEGGGGGSPRIKLNTVAIQTALTVFATGISDDDNPAVLWIGTHASNALRIYQGTLGVALLAGEVATVLTIDQAYRDNQESDTEVQIGSGVTLGTVVKTGGIADIACAIATAMTQHAEGGQATLRGTGAVAQLTILGGRVFYSTSGTLGGTTVVAGDGVLDFSRDMRAKTVTNPIEVHNDVAESIIDPFKVVTSLIVDCNQEPVMNIGTNVRITRGAVA